MPKLQKETVKKTKIMKKKQISKPTLFSYGSVTGVTKKVRMTNL